MNIELNLQVLSERLKYDLVFKVIIIGVGKTCLSSQATQKHFETKHYPTVGFEFFTYTTRMNEKLIKLQIWDTCGQEIFKSLMRNLFRNSSLAVIMYSIDNRESFLSLNNWLKELKTHSSPSVKVFLVGNKCDLDNKREVEYEEGLKFKEDNNLYYFTETSAMNGTNTNKIFEEATKVLYDEYLNYKTIMGSANNLQKSSRTLYLNHSKNLESSKSLLNEKIKTTTHNKSCCC